MRDANLPIYALSANEAAALADLSPRRVRQLHNDGDLPILPIKARGVLFDSAWLAHLLVGRSATNTRQGRRRVRAAFCVALGWLLSEGDRATEDRPLLIGVFERNGLTRDDALEALGHARGLLKR